MNATDDPCLQNGNVTIIPSSRVRRKEFNSSYTNTEPWFPQCRTCLENKHSSEFTFASKLINTREYVKAINYINSIHSFINGCLSKQFQNSSSSSSNFVSMPDLPNFLTIWSSLTNIKQSCDGQSCKMISKTTSTSSLHKKENHDCKSNFACSDNSQPTKESSKNQNSGASFLLYPQGREKQEGREMRRGENVKSRNKILHEAPLETSNSTSESEQSDLQQVSKFYSEQKQIFTTIYEPHEKIRLHKHTEQVYDMDENKGKPQNLMSTGDYCRHSKSGNSNRCRIARKKDNWSQNKKRGSRVTGDSKEKAGEDQVISDAELDHYASELLVGSMDSSVATPIMCEEVIYPSALPVPKEASADKLKNKKQSQPPSISSDSPRRKLGQRLGEVASKHKDRSTTGIPVKQNRVESLCKVRVSSSPPTKQKSCFSNSAISIPSTGCASKVQNRLRSTSPSGTHSTLECRVKEDSDQIIVTKQPTITTLLSARTPVITFQQSLVSEEAKHIPRKACIEHSVSNHQHSALMSNMAVTLPEHTDIKVMQDMSQKRSSTYTVMQKDPDDFVCSRKPLKIHVCRQSSESIILTDRDETEITNCVDSDTNEKRIDLRGAKPIKQCRVHNTLKKIQQSDQKNPKAQYMLSESGVPKRKRDARNKIFRQARKQDADSEEIIHIRNCLSHHKPLDESDTNSNITQSSISSDIKSDRDLSPVRHCNGGHIPVRITYTGNCKRLTQY